MATLHIMYDLEKKQFVGASSGGHYYAGLSSAVLKTGSISLLDFEGRDLLREATIGSESTDSENTQLQIDIAKALGFEDSEEGRKS